MGSVPTDVSRTNRGQSTVRVHRAAAMVAREVSAGLGQLAQEQSQSHHALRSSRNVEGPAESASNAGIVPEEAHQGPSSNADFARHQLVPAGAKHSHLRHGAYSESLVHVPHQQYRFTERHQSAR